MAVLLFFFESFDYAGQAPKVTHIVEFLIYFLLLLIMALVHNSG